METAKWFLAHSKQDGPEEVEQWCAKSVGAGRLEDKGCLWSGRL